MITTARTITLTEEEETALRMVLADNPSKACCTIYAKLAAPQGRQLLPAIDPSIGQAFRHYRKSHSIGLLDFSSQVYAHPVTVTQWETGRRRLPGYAVACLAHITGITPRELADSIHYIGTIGE